MPSFVYIDTNEVDEYAKKEYTGTSGNDFLYLRTRHSRVRENEEFCKVLCNKVYESTRCNKEGNQGYRCTMECEFCTTALELTEVTCSRSDRESSSLGLEHDKSDDDDGENNEENMEKGKHENRVKDKNLRVLYE
jgi:hypothetical protein